MAYDQNLADALRELDEVKALLSCSVGEVISDLQARLQAARDCRDAAQAEATKQTLHARDLEAKLDRTTRLLNDAQNEAARERTLAVQMAHKLATATLLNQKLLRGAFDEGFALSKFGGSIETAWQRSETKELAV